MAESSKIQNAGDEDETTESRFKITAAIRGVYEFISYCKKLYGNRAVIGRRLNVISMIGGIIFTLLYVAYVLYSGLAGKLSVNFTIVSIVLVALYAAVVIGCIVVAACSENVKTKNIKRFNLLLKILRYAAKLLSIAISVASLVLSIMAGSTGAAALAVDTLMIIVAVIFTVFQTILLFCGGVGGVIKWLISPVKRKVRFSAVALEWYGLAADDEKKNKKNKALNVSKKYIDDVGAVLDGWILPALGKKLIANISAEDLTASLEGINGGLLSVGEGTLKSVFEYACECGYITENPCDKLNFTGDIKNRNFARRAIDGVLGVFNKKAGG